MDHPSHAHAREYVVRRIKHAINLDLSSKGMKLLSDDPDILVAIHPMVSHHLNICNWGYSYVPYTVYWGGYGYWWGSRIDLYQYANGTLVIDLVESEKRTLVWRGVAEGTFPEIPVSEQIDKIVINEVTKILKNYPSPKLINE